MTQIASIVYKPIGQPNPENDYLRVDLDDATLIADFGIEGDAKGGHNPDRQLNIMSYETLTILRSQGFYTEPGQMGEQIVIHQLDVDALQPGDQVQLGMDAIIEIVKPRTGCAKFEAVQKKSPSLVQGMMGQMAKVVVGGKISVGDPVRLVKNTPVSQ